MRRYRIGAAGWMLALTVLLGSLCLPSRAAVGPRLEANPQKMDFGSMRQGEKKRKVFVLRNTGDETLVIDQVRASCAECVVDQKATYRIAPSEQAELPVTYHATVVPGKYTAHVTLHTNLASEPLQRVYLEVQVTERGRTPFLELAPREIDLGLVLLNAPVRRVLKVRNTGTAALRLHEVAPGPLVVVQGRPASGLAPGEDRDIVLELRGAEGGIVRTNVTIATNDPEQPTVTVPICGYAASAEQVERLAPGVVLVPQRSRTPGAELVSVRVTNNQETTVSVAGPGQGGGALALASGESGVVEVRPQSGGAEGSLLLQVLLPLKADAPQSFERKR